MNSIQIGKLIFTKKALLLLVFCLFLNGIIIGAIVASNQLGNNIVKPILLMLLLFLPYMIFIKKIRKNVKEAD